MRAGRYSRLGILFDMDGVLVDSNPVHKRVIQSFCQRHGKKVSESYFLEHISGRTNREWISHLFPDKSDRESALLADEKEQLFRETFDPAAAALPGLHPFLRELQDHPHTYGRRHVRTGEKCGFHP